MVKPLMTNGPDMTCFAGFTATDNEGSELVGKALGQTRTLAMGTDSKSVKPSPKAMQKVNTNGA